MFKVGQKVWCVVHGEGKVVAITTDDTCPVVVRFNSGAAEDYTKSGSLYSDVNRTLFFSPPVISAETEPPFVPTLVGKKVLVQYNRLDLMSIVTVFKETVDRIYIDSFGNYWLKEDVTIYEITPVTFKD